MTDHHGVSRRHVLGVAIVAGGFTLSGGVSSVFAQALKRTPGEILGPFYPVLRSVEKAADLTILPGKPGRAAGQAIYVMGRVVNLQGQPLKGARVELWQANTHGRYTHPSDTNPAPLDPNFEGFAIQDTDHADVFPRRSVERQRSLVAKHPRKQGPAHRTGAAPDSRPRVGFAHRGLGYRA